MPDALIGQQLGDYQIRDLLGRGGMARVYLGYDSRLERRAAVKVINTDTHDAEREEYFKRFQNEARAIAKLEHPNIVSVYQFGEFEDSYYMAMAFVEGGDLRQVLREYNDRHERMPLADVVNVVRQIGSALDYAHSRGVIHRDVKPSNIMITKANRAVLTDFGLALSASEGTQGETFGSAHYIAPEQALSSAKAVPQSDLYSLGICTFEMLTGKPPFDDPSAMSIALKHLQDPVPSLSEYGLKLPDGCEAVINRVLDKDPAARYQTGLQFAQALQKAVASAPAIRPISASQVKPPAAKTETPAAAVPDLLPSQPKPLRTRPSTSSNMTVNTDNRPTEPPLSPEPAAGPTLIAGLDRRLIAGAGIALAAIAFLCLVGAALMSSTAGSPAGTPTQLVAAQTSPLPTLSAASTAADVQPTASRPASLLLPTDLPTQVNPSGTSSATTPSDTPGVPSTTRAGLATVGTGSDVTLMWDGNQLDFINSSDQPLSVKNLIFTQQAKDETRQFTASQWSRPPNGNVSDQLRPGQCYQLGRYGLLLPPTFKECASMAAFWQPGLLGQFWIPSEGASETFDVYWDKQLLATCTINAGVCNFAMPPG